MFMRVFFKFSLPMPLSLPTDTVAEKFAGREALGTINAVG